MDAAEHAAARTPAAGTAKAATKATRPAAKSTTKSATQAVGSSPAAKATGSTGSRAAKAPAKAAPTKAAPTKTVPTKTAPTKTAPTKAAPTKTAPTKTAPAKAAQTRSAPARTAAAKKAPAVAAGTDWTPEELAEVRGDLTVKMAQMQLEYNESIAALNELQQAGNDGAGDDQADAGSKTFDREQEQSIAANRMDLLTQMQHALDRIDSGTYGFCESCGNPIPRARLQAFPMATLDVACKQREERR